MTEKKMVSRKITAGISILCIVLLVGFVGAVINYNSLLNVKDAVISEKNLMIGNQTSQVSTLQELTDERQTEIEDLTSQLSQDNSTIANIDQQLSQKNNQVANLNEQVNQKENEISSLSSQLSQKESTIANLNEQVNQKENEISSLSSQLSQKESTIANLNEQISDLENQRDSLRSQVTDLSSQISELQTQRDTLTSEISSLTSQIVNLQTTYDDYVAAYQKLRRLINQRSIYIDISDFITPQDPDVISTMYSITGGWNDTSNFNEFLNDIKALYIWTRDNIEYRDDGLSPILPSDPVNSLQYREDMWQFPNETLELRKGDCDDKAILLCAMIRSYTNRVYAAECVWITSSTAAHVGVQVPGPDDRLAIFDPTGNFYSSDFFGNVVFNDVSVEINNWLNYWKPTMGNDIQVYRVFSDQIDQTFSSTSEYLFWMYG